MRPTKFRFIWINGFRGEESKKSTNQKKESPVAAMFANGSGRNEESLQRTFHRCFLPSFGSFGQAVSEEKIFKNRPIRNKNCLWWPFLLMDGNEMITLFSVHLAKRLQRNFFLIISQSETRVSFLWRPCLLTTDRDEMRNLYRGPSIDASCQGVSEEKIKKNLPIRNKNCLWRPCLLMDRDEMNNIFRGPSIDASYQVSVHLSEGFQRRR